MPSSEDPFENLSLDEDFVRGAPVKEPSASARRRAEEQAQVKQIREARRARRRRRAGRILRRGALLSVLVALVAGAWISYNDRRDDEAPPATAHSDVAMPDVNLAAGLPPPSTEEQPAPIGRPPPLPSPGGPHAFIALQGSGAPVAYDPCRPIHITVNSGTAPPEGERILGDALAQVSAATGLSFVDDGPTDEHASESRAPYQPERYPGRWAPVLIAWADDGTDARLRDDTSGYAGSVAIAGRAEADSVYVTGQVVLDGPQLDEILGQPGGVAAARAVILHELGHLVGLQHVDDEDQIMNPVGRRAVTDYAAGDRTGLALLGRGQCFPSI